MEKTRLYKDKGALIYNQFLTPEAPPEKFAYPLGNRSAIELMIDQNQ
ncbi:MAG: hypothetical protein ABI651_08410 [Verrucomicrobiota bacterium]